MLIVFMDDFIFVDAQFFFAPSEEHEPLGKEVSISFVDKYPNFDHKAKILKNFEESGLYLLDYEITYRPINKNDDLEPYNITRH